MSADLFAEFGETPSQPQQTSVGNRDTQAAQTFSLFDSLAPSAPAPALQNQLHSQPIASNEAEDDDEWGDFEGPTATTPAAPKQDALTSQPSAQTWEASQSSWQPAPVFNAKKSYDSNVLFDAEDEVGEEEDEFGDFEGPGSSSAPAPPPASGTGQLIDLMGDLEISQPVPPSIEQRREQKTTSKPSASTTKKKPVHGFGPIVRTKQPEAASPPAPARNEEPWASFDDWEASIPATQQPKPTSKVIPSQSEAVAAQSPALMSMDEPEPGELPPTNVPPPALLLSLFLPLFAEAQEKLFKPLAAQALPMRNRLLSDPVTIAYLQGYLSLASVAARIIAGRKLRWKRDVHLSQGMRIGPASSRGTSGMKLTGIDKSENLKEEREVSDVVRAWKEQVGKLRHAVAAANQAKSRSLGAVPDIQETMAVRTLKQAEGGIPARQSCMLCGLKREERVTAADVDVEDSSGEWWVDQVSMHRGCRNFWQQHKDRLRQR
ncbi:uncharacterized protein EI97DRAFT_400358 [Westerdykella ornata]|uniref:Uncharacterized protein n=1 Tax=Westerdykella ornata TaxID=318751 RepID=A0A6A6JGG9_WESOR|nr:uncharacterized protein EI97DRAFT_400358 [Westerdykella ornata]KAF2275437.1 hypothetical protein EI97DRAFT_400358 [Westerdykella ornata]